MDPAIDFNNKNSSKIFQINEDFLNTDYNASPDLSGNKFDMEYMKSIMTKTHTH